MKSLLAYGALFAIAWMSHGIYLVAQAVPDQPIDWLSLAGSGSAAALVWFLLVSYMPKREKRFEERMDAKEAANELKFERQSESHQKERIDLVSRLDKKDEAFHSTLGTIAEQHRLATESGHNVARELGREINELGDKIEKKISDK